MYNPSIVTAAVFSFSSLRKSLVVRPMAAPPSYPKIFGLVPDNVLPPVRVQHVPEDSVSDSRGNQASATPPVFLERAKLQKWSANSHKTRDEAGTTAFFPAAVVALCTRIKPRFPKSLGRADGRAKLDGTVQAF